MFSIVALSSETLFILPISYHLSLFSFTSYASHLSNLILLVIVACILYFSHFLVSCLVCFFCSRGQSSLSKLAFFPLADVLYSFCRVPCLFCSTFLGVRTVDIFHIQLVSLSSFVIKSFLLLLLFLGAGYLFQTPAQLLGIQ